MVCPRKNCPLSRAKTPSFSRLCPPRPRFRIPRTLPRRPRPPTRRTTTPPLRATPPRRATTTPPRPGGPPPPARRLPRRPNQLPLPRPNLRTSHTLKILSVKEVGGAPACTFKVDSTIYKDQRVGDVVSTSWGQIQVVEIALSSNCRHSAPRQRDAPLERDSRSSGSSSGGPSPGQHRR